MSFYIVIVAVFKGVSSCLQSFWINKTRLVISGINNKTKESLYVGPSLVQQTAYNLNILSVP